MSTSKPKLISKPKKQSFQYATATSANLFTILGFLFWPILIDVGIVLGMIWMFRMSKDRSKIRLVWWAILAFFIAIEVFITVVG